MVRKEKKLDEILSRLGEIERWARDGATDTDMARFFNIGRTTWYEYKKKDARIGEALKRGRTNLVLELKGTLLKKAQGFMYEERKVIKEDGRVVREEIYYKAAPPDVAAINLLLKNYDKDNWANDPQALALRKKELELAEKRAEANEW